MNKRSMKEYRIWKAMKSRCYSPSQTNGCYKTNGIAVCEKWRNSFDAFISDMGPLPGGDYSIERIDVMRDYEPSNCKWIPVKEQPKNRTNTIWASLNGEQKCLSDIARIIGIPYTTLYMRYRRNGPEAVDVAIRDYYGMEGGSDGKDQMD